MKAKVIIENGITEILLTPENDFEKDIIEKVNFLKGEYSTNVEFNVKEKYGTVTYRHEISITTHKINR